MDKQNYFTYIDNTSDNTDKTMKNLYKQTIIDGVDVSKCRYLFDDTLYKRSKTSCSITLKDCKYLGNNCYYKQLKAKEQECEELKEQLTILNDEDVVVEITVKQFEEYKKLKAENEGLKKVSCKFKDYCNCDTEKLKQTLTEIKEIAKYELNNLTESAINGGRYVEILQKISEVEE